MIERITVYYDGTAGPREPGEHGAFAFIVFDNDERIYQVSGYLETKGSQRISNTLAEYLALLKALEWLIENKKAYNHVRFYGDTLMIVNHLNKEYPYKPNGVRITEQEWKGIWEAAPGLEPLKREAIRLAAQFRDIQFSWVSKAQILQVRELAESELIKKGVNPARITKEKEKAALLDKG